MYDDKIEYYNFLSENNFNIFSEPYSFDEYPESVLNPNLDWKKIGEEYTKEKIVVVDNFLAANIAQRLKNYLLYLNIRQDIYPDYAAVNFYKKQGELWFPILTNIIKESKENCIFLSSYDFIRAWAFIYNNQSKGVPVHADPAAINFNLWVTDNDSIINIKDNNGLELWKVYPPTEWTWEQYNGDKKSIIQYLKEYEKDKISIEYKFNRVTIFDSKFFHKTQPVITKSGYENRRINYTFLFGNSV
jgi:hypothetical protein